MHTTKNKYRQSILLLMLTILLSISCETMIEVDPPTDRIDQSEIYKDIATAKAALNNLYFKFAVSTTFNKSNPGTSFNLSLYTDELDFYGTNSSTMDIYENNISDIHTTNNNWWNTSYHDVYTINAFIEGVRNSTLLDNNFKELALGEAYTLKALYYYYLTILYGDIPYTSSTDYNTNKNLKKISHNEVMLKIESDLKTAIELLDYSYRDPNKFYINKAVAEVLLTEILIQQQRYEEAEKIAKNILDQGIYEIVPDLSKTFKKDARSTIWQIAPRYTSDITSEASLYIFSNFTWYSATMSHELINSFDQNDLRKKHWVKKININNQEFHQVYKYKNQQNNTDEFSIFYRIEQIYFHLAYSQYMQGKNKEGLATLNFIRNNRGLSDLPELNHQDFIKSFLKESSKEFFTENGRRFFDLKLTNQLAILKINKPNFQPHHNLFPIPYRQLEINKNLLPNNPGY
ncbi:RagB/SusD family nutrient uptake outer membrane protein [Myroides pelagicus]|uniref:RagB/SusD family nutrient uptake outer membrane protein n=1 Tax=Myroides pelagicus TaxID=270914 RepID=A0A7K1GQ82_9FLAO|nr:RagB/SusD family nutrient uptake outer membrane protein [Myroides pelagicus]MTH30890.1 RagB/SusD family nutrient uptake outer membrane protein [Myroides pelagicus]